MKKEDLLIIILFLCLLLAAVVTWLLGGEKSRHGLGASLSPVITPISTAISPSYDETTLPQSLNFARPLAESLMIYPRLCQNEKNPNS